jgi:NAD(P)H-dependent FMN reductase
MHVLVLVGSLRAGSLNRRLAAVALRHLPAGTTATVWPDLGRLPHYDQDLDGGLTGTVPESVAALRTAMTAADALLVVTPEYNGSLPGVLKNALDWLSRPRGQASIAGKPAAVLGASLSGYAARWAREDAVRVLRVAGADVLEETVGVPGGPAAFAGDLLVEGELDHAVGDLVGALLGRAQALAA